MHEQFLYLPKELAFLPLSNKTFSNVIIDSLKPVEEFSKDSLAKNIEEYLSNKYLNVFNISNPFETSQVTNLLQLYQYVDHITNYAYSREELYSAFKDITEKAILSFKIECPEFEVLITVGLPYQLGDFK